MNAYDVFEHLLNLKDPKAYKTIEVDDGTGGTIEKRVVDAEATKILQSKAEKLTQAFEKWVFADPKRREELVQTYNELFNSVKPREYDGSHLTFPMMNTAIKLHDHQKNAIAHAMFGGNTLFAHAVGAGKTFEMIATAMESKRLGLCTKSLFAVPNHLTEQIGADFMKLYPSANILVATKNDFKKENRQQLFAKIATGNYDAVIIGHSQLGMIPLSPERQMSELQHEIDDVTAAIKAMKEQGGSRTSVKKLERTKKSLEKRMGELSDMKRDDMLNFEQLGIDRLFVDEAHEFKNLFTVTKLENVAGIGNTPSKKALDLYMKCRYLDEKTGNRGTILATGTPLTNSLTELHVMMRYLEHDLLKAKGLDHFDSFIGAFGVKETDWELSPAGKGFKLRTRIPKFTGVPEIQALFKQVADVRTADTLKLNVPDCDIQVVESEPTLLQQDLVDELADRAEAVQNGNVEPTVDNLLKITSDGRKVGLDPRLVDPTLEDDPGTKLNKCVENVVRIHSETAEQRSTQIIFCDLGVPGKGTQESGKGEEDEEISAADRDSLEEVCDFCVYNDIRDKLIAKGVPKEEIAYIHDAKTEKQKDELFAKVRSGEVRVLIGSTAKMGTGTNVQKKLIAVHDLDIPWRPADLEQRAGRIIRQGNENKNVSIFRYVTKGTFDAYSYQILEKKQRFISQIMTSKSPARRIEDVDQQALTFSEIKTLCTGDERIREKLSLENEVKTLSTLVNDHKNTVYEMQDRIAAFPEREQKIKDSISAYSADLTYVKALPRDENGKPALNITIGGKSFESRKDMAAAINKAYLSITSADSPVKIGKFQGLDMYLTANSQSNFAMIARATITIEGHIDHRIDIDDPSSVGTVQRLENAMSEKALESRIDIRKSNLDRLRTDLAEAEKIVSQPFPQQDELSAKQSRLKTLTEQLTNEAIEAKKNAPAKQKTCYFSRAEHRKNLKRNIANVAPKKEKSNNKDKQGLE
ncbi:MAG: DEAD/DEAH box helicase family protein [Ruminococcus sp.]|nr:DEAD/DEAH box helicase family protein [Ruminococcus sp.]